MSIYHIHSLLFCFGHFFFFLHQYLHGKLSTDLVAIFKLLRVFSWSPSNPKLFTPSKGLHIKKMPFFDNFRSWLRIGLKKPAVSSMEILVSKTGACQLLVIVTKD